MKNKITRLGMSLAGMTALMMALSPAFAAPAKKTVPKPKPAPDSPQELYKSYLQAKTWAPKIQADILADKELADRLSSYENRKTMGAVRIIEASTATKKTAAIEYLLSHHDDFVVDWNEGLFCKPNIAGFLVKIERKKPAEEGWYIRRDYLGTLKDVNMPWCDDCLGHNFITLLSALKETKVKYYKDKKAREQMSAWIKGVIAALEKEIRQYRKAGMEDSGTEQESRIATVKNWIDQLEEIDKP